MKLFVLITLVAAVTAHKSACIPKPISNVEPLPPASVTRVTAAASASFPSLSTDISVIEALTLSSPNFIRVESVIESYAQSHYDLISSLEYYFESPSAITSPTNFAYQCSEFPNLVSAVTLLLSEEELHSSLSAIQSSFQAAMVSYPSILTVGETSFEFSHASLISVESGISKADISSPSVVTDVIRVSAMESLSPSLSVYFCDLTQAAADYPTALHDITTARDWTSVTAWVTNANLKSVETCYPTLYYAITAIGSFIESHSSDDSAFSNVVSVLISSPHIMTEVSSFISSVSPSVEQDLTRVSQAQNIDSHITTELSYIDVLEASSPSLACAESTLGREVASQYTVIDDLEDAVSHPSMISDTVVQNEIAEYPSIRSAVEAVACAESSHPSLIQIQYSIQSVEATVPYIVTDAQAVISLTSPSLVQDDDDLQEAVSLCSSITTDLEELSDVIVKSPSLSCAVSIIEQYASSNPTILFTIEEALSSPSIVSSTELKLVTQETNEYPSLASAVRTLISCEKSYPSVQEAISSFEYVIQYIPDVFSVEEQMTEYSYMMTEEVCSFASSSEFYERSYHYSN